MKFGRSIRLEIFEEFCAWARVKRSGESRVDRVGDFDGLVEGGEFDEADDGAEDLFAVMPTGGRRLRQGWLASGGAVGISPGSERAAAAKELRSLVLRESLTYFSEVSI